MAPELMAAWRPGAYPWPPTPGPGDPLPGIHLLAAPGDNPGLDCGPAGRGRGTPHHHADRPRGRAPGPKSLVPGDAPGNAGADGADRNRRGGKAPHRFLDPHTCSRPASEPGMPSPADDDERVVSRALIEQVTAGGTESPAGPASADLQRVETRVEQYPSRGRQLTETVGYATPCNLQYQAVQIPIAVHHLLAWSYWH